MLHIAPLPRRFVIFVSRYWMSSPSYSRRHKHNRLFLAALMSVIAVAPLNTTEPKERHQDMTPVAYFMDQPPPDVDAPNNLPKDTQDITVAKVRFADGQGSIWLGGRHCEGCTNDIFGAHLKIVELYAGRAAHIGEEVFVHFGLRSEHRQFMAIPLRDQTSRDYIVVIYMGGGGKLRLVPFRISKFEYDKWLAERSASFGKSSVR
jgi:hypothetical protein